MATHHPIRKIVAPEIPDKLYFRIGDVARLCEVPAYVLRFWETEFPQLKPNKGGTGQRLYRKRDVEMALRIKSLLYDQGYTIPGARQVFKSEARLRETGPAAPEPEAQALPARGPSTLPGPVADPVTALQRDRLHDLRAQMAVLLASLSAPAGAVPLPAPAAPAKTPRLQMIRPRLVAMKAEAGSPRPDLFSDMGPDRRPSLFSLESDDQAKLFPASPASVE